LFRAVAEAEGIHAFNHLRLLGGVTDTQENLQAREELPDELSLLDRVPDRERVLVEVVEILFPRQDLTHLHFRGFTEFGAPGLQDQVGELELPLNGLGQGEVAREGVEWDEDLLLVGPAVVGVLVFVRQLADDQLEHADFAGQQVEQQINVAGNLYVGPRPRNRQEELDIYCRVVAQACGQLPLRGVDVGASDPTAGQKPLGLANVYIDLDTRAAAGLKKYGVSLERMDLTGFKRENSWETRLKSGCRSSTL
jgi:hypothetical protein